jgi:hypothetical protein
MGEYKRNTPKPPNGRPTHRSDPDRPPTIGPNLPATTRSIYCRVSADCNQDWGLKPSWRPAMFSRWGH